MVTRSSATAVAGLLYCASAFAGASAAPACADPQALGTFRTMTIGGAPEIGLKTYPQTLGLADHEVVLTFDDGPSPATTPKVLDALKAQCVEATFFLVGRNAQAHPALVRREVAEGHSVGHHTFDHPAATLRGLSFEAALHDIDRGMEADDKAAGYGWTGEPRVPFFRFPGFGDTPDLRASLKKRGIAVFGADLWASDWIAMTPDAEFDRLMERLKAAGRGIILLHDIKQETADMLPRFLVALKQEGFRVVEIVPGGAATSLRSAPAGWTSETEKALAHLRSRAGSGSVSAAVLPRLTDGPAAATTPASRDDEDAVPLKADQD